MPMQPLPPREWPIAAHSGGVAPANDEYYAYLSALDQIFRSAPGFAGAVASDTSAVAHTLATADFLSGVLLRSGTGAPFGDTTPSAASIVTSISKAQIGTSRLIMIANNTAFLMALTAGAGVTLQGNTGIAANSARWYLLTVTSATAGAETVSLRGLMTGAM